MADVVRIVKCLSHGCSVEATADICEVDTRTVQRFLLFPIDSEKYNRKMKISNNLIFIIGKNKNKLQKFGLVIQFLCENEPQEIFG